MSSSEAIVLSLFYGVAIVAGCVMNFLIIISILSNAELRGRRANHFLAGLCFSDFLTCLFSMTYHLLHLHEKIYSQFLSTTYCRVTQYFVYVLAFSSTLCLTMVCIDRYLAIIHPFFYVTGAMAKLSNVLIAWPWVLSTTTAIPALLTDMIDVGTDFGFPCAAASNWNSLRYFIAVIPVNIVIPFLCIVVTCLMVYRAARKQLRRIQAQIPLTRNSSPEQSIESKDLTNDGSTLAQSGSLSASSPTTRDKNVKSNLKKVALKHRLRLVFREETRIAFATIAVVIGFVIAWTPYLISRLLYAVGEHLSNDVYMFGTVFVLSNSAWNPLLILSFRKDVRRSFRKLGNRVIRSSFRCRMSVGHAQ